MEVTSRPVISAEVLDDALQKANLSKSEHELIDYLRYTGVFSQPSLVKDLRIKTMPPVFTIICEICKKVGNEIPEHFKALRKWSESVNENGVHWDGDLICSTARNIDGEPLSPQSGTAPYEILVIHKEFFTGIA